MSKLNWNRPRGGYESEPWQKPYNKKDFKPLQPAYKLLGNHADHPAEVRMMPWGPAIFCLKCQRQITSISRDDYNFYRRTQ